MEHKPVGYAALFRHNKNYRYLFGARMVSLFGDWFHLLALLVLLREMGGESASAFAGILIFKALPALVVSPTAGSVADRMNRLHIMWVSDAIRVFIVLSMLFLMWWPSLPLLYGLIILQSAVGSFFDPAMSATVPEIVTEQELTAANAVSAASWSVMLTLGTAAGGLFTAMFGWQLALVVDAASYLLSIGLLMQIRGVTASKNTSNMTADLLGMSAFKESIVYLRQQRDIATLALAKSAWSAVASTTLLLTLYGEDVFPAEGQLIVGVTAFYVVRGIGTGVGPVVSRWLAAEQKQRMESLIGLSFLLASLAYAVVSVAPTMPVALLGVAIAHLGGATLWVFSTIRLQQEVPKQMMGRVFAFEQGMFTVLMAGCVWMQGMYVDLWGGTPRGLATLVSVGLMAMAVLWGIREWRLGMHRSRD